MVTQEKPKRQLLNQGSLKKTPREAEARWEFTDEKNSELRSHLLKICLGQMRKCCPLPLHIKLIKTRDIVGSKLNPEKRKLKVAQVCDIQTHSWGKGYKVTGLVTTHESPTE